MYQALYRKYRPRTFDDVAGQEHITTTLKNELKNGRISHAYLFTGSRGTGKTSCAKILAKAVNCLNPHDGSPCGECEICRDIDSGRSIDVFEIDAASNRKIDSIREIIDEVQTAPHRCKYRVYIIDEVHMLTAEAFNALLKILEEPPKHVVFILATTEVHKILLTIQSRCQRFDFHRIAPHDIADRLLYVAQKEDAQLSDSAAMLIASVSDGAMRDALSLMDRCLAISRSVDDSVVRSAAGLAGKDYLFDLAACVINKNTAKALEIIDRLYRDAKDMSKLCDELTEHFRALMLIKSVRNPRDIVVFTDKEFEMSQTQADYLSLADIVYFMDVLSRSYQRMGKGTGDRTELEMALVKLCSPELDVTNEAFAARITALERAVKKGISVQATTVEAPMSEPKEEENITEFEENPAAEIHEETEAPEKTEKPSHDSENKPEQQINEKSEPPKPAENNARASQRDVDIIELSRKAVPFPQWVEVVEAIKSTSRSLAAAFSGSTAYENGGFLLIDCENVMAFELLRQGDMRRNIRDILQQITGRAYRLGPYKTKTEQEVKEEDPLSSFKEKLAESGIKYTEE